MRSLLSGAAGLALAGCFYIDPINTAPTATIQVTSGPYHLNDSAHPTTFTAVAADPDGDAIQYEWHCTGCNPNFSGAPQYVTTFDVHGSVQVRLIAKDSHGAEDTSLLPIDVSNQAPMLPAPFITTSAKDNGAFTVTRPIVVTASATDPDGDPVTYDAMPHAPPLSDPNVAQFVRPDPTKASWTLTPDVPGNWSVDVTASDAFGGSATNSTIIVVDPDQPPCLAVTAPDVNAIGSYPVLRDDGPRRFTVASVNDDLDPYPGGGTRFAWSLGPKGTVPAPVAGHDFPDFTIDPSGYLPGDVLDLRVEISDRIARTLACAADQPRCSIGGNGCFQRATWEVEIR